MCEERAFTETRSKYGFLFKDLYSRFSRSNISLVLFCVSLLRGVSPSNRSSFVNSRPINKALAKCLAILFIFDNFDVTKFFVLGTYNRYIAVQKRVILIQERFPFIGISVSIRNRNSSLCELFTWNWMSRDGWPWRLQNKISSLLADLPRIISRLGPYKSNRQVEPAF